MCGQHRAWKREVQGNNVRSTRDNKEHAAMLKKHTQKNKNEKILQNCH